MGHKPQCDDLDGHFNTEDAREHVVKVRENTVPGGILVDRVFSCEADAAHKDAEKDERIEPARCA